jgi:hypothetical protein
VSNGLPGSGSGFIGTAPGTVNTPVTELGRQVGAPARIQRDIAFQPPVDPLTGKSAAIAKIVYRDIPIIDAITQWSVDGMRAALRSHMWGIFNDSAQLCDAILGDDRVQATLASCLSGLFGREVIFEPANDSAAAKECLDDWVECWPRLATPAAMSTMGAYGKIMGWTDAQLAWDTTGPIWCPEFRPWHPRFEFYHWTARCMVAISQDGLLPVIAGDGKWFSFQPYGQYRGWIRGAIRSTAEPWLIRHWAFRDWARYSEIHGIPIMKAYAPAASDPAQRDPFELAVANLGSEGRILLPRGVDGSIGYDVAFAEPQDQSWESFPGLIDRCDMAIVLSILMQNLTTEVKGGSFAATTSHMDIRQGGIVYDNVAWRTGIRQQIARPFALFNHGDPDLAPKTQWDVTSRDEFASNAKQFIEFGTGVEMLRRGGIEFIDQDAVRRFANERFGLRGLPAFKIVEPVSSGMGGGGR